MTAAMNASFRLPPAAAAARLRSASCTSSMSRWRAIPRSVMIGDSVSLTGASVRAIDRAVSNAPPTPAAGCVAVRRAVGTADLTAPIARPRTRCRIPVEADEPASAGVRRRRRFDFVRSAPFAGSRLEVEELERELHPADSVGQRMVDLHDQRRASVGEPLDQRELPQGASVIEGGHHRVARRRRGPWPAYAARARRSGGGGR